jgi:hypothetical protein
MATVLLALLGAFHRPTDGLPGEHPSSVSRRKPYSSYASAASGGWHASKSGAVELASALFDACLDVRRVALDPIPEIGLCGPHDLVSLSRK